MPLNANELLLAIEQKGSMPLRVRLTMALRDAVRSGTLPAGARMPSSRVLAADLGVSRGIVLEVYAQLKAEGFLHTRPGSATTVATVAGVHAQALSERPIARLTHGESGALDLRPGLPDLSTFPRRQWLASIRRSLSVLPDMAFGYGEPWGVHELRQELADYLARVRGAMGSAQSLVVMTGATQGISLLAQLLATQGHRSIAVEDPSNGVQQRVLADRGLDVVGVPVDEHGLRVDLLAKSSARAVIVTPAHQYPTGAILSAQRREQLVGWAGSVDATIIEDDYDSEFRYGKAPVGCLQSLDPDHVALVGSVSKSLAPALRIGWVVSPPGLLEPLRRVKTHADFGSPALDQHAFADFLASGEYDRNLRALRRRYSQHRASLASSLQRHLPEWSVMGVAGGLHLVARLPPSLEEAQMVAAAEGRGVLVLGVKSLQVTHAHDPALVLSFARGTPDQHEEAVRRLAQAADDVRSGEPAPAPAPTPRSGLDWYEELT